MLVPEVKEVSSERNERQTRQPMASGKMVGQRPADDQLIIVWKSGWSLLSRPNELILVADDLGRCLYGAAVRSSVVSTRSFRRLVFSSIGSSSSNTYQTSWNRERCRNEHQPAAVSTKDVPRQPQVEWVSALRPSSSSTHQSLYKNQRD